MKQIVRSKVLERANIVCWRIYLRCIPERYGVLPKITQLVSVLGLMVLTDLSLVAWWGQPIFK
jgi:hypothetical protein